MSSRPSFLQFADDLRHECLVTRSQRRYADDVHVVLDGLLGRLGRGLEQRSHIDVEADVGIAGGDYLGPPVVAVLTQLGHHDARLAALLLRRTARPKPWLRSKSLVVFHFCRVYAGDGADHGLVAARRPPRRRRRSRPATRGPSRPRRPAPAGCLSWSSRTR